MGTRKKTEHLIKEILVTLAIICIYDIQFTEGGVTASRDSNMVLDALQQSALDYADIRSLTWWNTLSQAIDEFAHEYQSQHKTTIQVTRQLKQIDSDVYPSKKDDYCEIATLEFSYMRNDQQVQDSVIVEIPDLGMHYAIGKSMSFYTKETYMYQVVLPLMYQSWSHEKLTPNSYASKESEILILENLPNTSYLIQDFLLNSLEQCKIVFKSIAQFHALSIVHLHEDEYSTLRSLTPFEMLSNFAVLSNTLSEAQSNYEKQLLSLPIPFKMKEEIRRVNEDRDSAYRLLYTPSTNFNVVLHGSLNTMTVYFKRGNESRDLTSCKFVDFRLSRQGSPVVDLMTYLMNNVEFEVFKLHQDSLFSFYLLEFHKVLAERKHIQQYDLNDLQADLRSYKQFFIQHLVYHVPEIRRLNQFPATVDELAEIYNRSLQSDTFLTFLKNWMEVFLTW